MPQGRPLRSTDPDEQSLIAAAQRDPDRFAELYELHFERVYAYCIRRVRDRAEAQDLTSEVFHQALTSLRRYEWRGIPFAGWLYRIAAHAVADRANRLSREQGTAAVEPTDDVNLEEIEHRSRIFRWVRELPLDQRRVLEMRFIEEKSIREIAQELDRSEGAVKQLQFRGLETLRAWVGDKNG